MSLTSQRSGTSFGGVGNASQASQPGTPEYFAGLIIRAAKELNMTPTVTLVSQALGTIDAEGGFDGSLWNNNPAHPGPWGLGSSYGSYAERVDPYRSTYLAMQDRKSNGGFEHSWWKFEKEQGEVETGEDRAANFVAIAEAAGAGGSNPSLGEELPLIGGLVGDAEGAVTDAGDFLSQALGILTDYKKLGQLAAEGMAWFLRLIAKAIWDYVIAPLVHWGERAVSFYWVNFFGEGVERGSGFGYQLRQNAGTITILFWSLGYAILWSDGSSVSMVAPHESLLGQGFKGVEGAIKSRKLIQPKEIKKRTPKKPTAKVSTVPIARQETFSTGRKRAVRVSGANRQHTEGRTRYEGSGGRQHQPQPVPRPGGAEQSERQKIVLPPGVEAPVQASSKGRSRVDSQPNRGRRA